MEVSAFPGGMPVVVLCFFGNVNSQAHFVQWPLVLSSRGLHDRCWRRRDRCEQEEVIHIRFPGAPSEPSVHPERAVVPWSVRGVICLTGLEQGGNEGQFRGWRLSGIGMPKCRWLVGLLLH